MNVRPHSNAIYRFMNTKTYLPGMLWIGVWWTAGAAFAGEGVTDRLRASIEEHRDRKHLYSVVVSLKSTYRKRRRFRMGVDSASADQVRYRKFVLSAQRDFKKSLSGEMASQIVHIYHNIPALAMRLNAAQIEKLSIHPLVELIDEAEKFVKFDAESFPLTGVDLAQHNGYRGEGITVAVIDDGIQVDHPAFGGKRRFPNPKIVGGYDIADNDNDPRVDCDSQSHGTNVSGMIAGNGGGITGVAPDANLVFVKVQGQSNCGMGGIDGDIIEAMDWVIDHRDTYDISVLAMSVGSAQTYSSVEECETEHTAYVAMAKAAQAAGITIFAASGNDGLCQGMSAPACVRGVVSVGAVYEADIGNAGFCLDARSCALGLTEYVICGTGYGAIEGKTYADKVPVYSNSAPFLDLLAPAHCSTTAHTAGGTRDCFGGTSAAVPFAAGVAALVLESAGGSRSMSPSELGLALKRNGVPVVDGRMQRSTPRVDAKATIEAVSNAPFPL